MPATERQREWYRENLDRERTKRREHAREHRVRCPEADILKRAKARALAAGIPFDLTVDDIVIPDCCPILGYPLKRKTRYAPSLDRIKPEQGYVKGNVWVISRKANVMKNDATPEELERFARWVRQLTP